MFECVNVRNTNDTILLRPLLLFQKIPTKQQKNNCYSINTLLLIISYIYAVIYYIKVTTFHFSFWFLQIARNHNLSLSYLTDNITSI